MATAKPTAAKRRVRSKVVPIRSVQRATPVRRRRRRRMNRIAEVPPAPQLPGFAASPTTSDDDISLIMYRRQLRRLRDIEVQLDGLRADMAKLVTVLESLHAPATRRRRRRPQPVAPTE